MESSLEVTTNRKQTAFDKRVHEIDLFRGILIIFVFVDHLLNNFLLHSATWFELTGHEFWNAMDQAMNWYWFCPARTIVRCIILGLFCLVSGISCAFSRNNWKRAAETLGLGAIIAVGSNILQAWGIAGQNVRVDHNIIMVLGWSTLFYCFFQDKKNNALIYATIGIFLFSIVVVPILYNFVPNAPQAYVPSLWEPLGEFTQADWMPLFPYIGFFFIGAIIARFFYKDKSSHFKRYEWERPICFLGRHTLLIYLSHYLILMGIFNLIEVILKAIYA